MPIEIQDSVQAVDQATFKSIDYKVMGIAYRIHQELGRLFDEKVYAAALAEQLDDAGIDARREVQIKLTHDGFEKKYRIDLLVNSSIPYELKTVDRFHPSHDAQVLQYLFLTSVRHGKLLNFGSRSVEGRFIDSKIDGARRTASSLKSTQAEMRSHILRTLKLTGFRHSYWVNFNRSRITIEQVALG